LVSIDGQAVHGLSEEQIQAALAVSGCEEYSSTFHLLEPPIPHHIKTQHTDTGLIHQEKLN
jgi:hypothetical protein